MLKPYKKMSKRELKQDKFVEFTIQAKDFMEKYSRQLMWGGVIVLVVIVVISFLVRSKREANLHANEMLGKATFAFEQGDIQRGETLMTELIDTYQGVPAAGQGCFMLAKYYWQKNDFENARKYFQAYLDDYGDDPLLTAAANAGYGDGLVEQGQLAEAARYYEKAARVDQKSPQAPSFLYSAARSFMDAGDYDKAEKLANEIIKMYEKSDYKNKAEILLNMIKMQA